MPLAPVQLNVERVLVDEQARQLLDRADHGKLFAFQRRLAYPFNPFVGIDLDKDIVAVTKVNHKGFDISDFHCGGPSCSLVVVL